MENLKLLFLIYLRPASAMSDIIDRGNWLFAIVAVLIVAGAFYSTINTGLQTVYRVRSFSEYYSPDYERPADDAAEESRAKSAYKQFQTDGAARPRVPVVGDTFFYFFSFDAAKFYYPILLLSIFYIPCAILLVCLFGKVGSFGLVLRRDYGTLSVCTLYAWAAAHLPFAIVGYALSTLSVGSNVHLALWCGSGALFGVFMVFALRTVFGIDYLPAISVVAVAWLSLSFGLLVFEYVSPLLFSPFLLFFVIMYLGGSIGGEVRGFGNALRRKQNFKRFLHNATVNPLDADAHVQLGLIFLQRRQEGKAIEHFERALKIDVNEIDANYEMGKIARAKGELQAALNHFAIVLDQDDKHSLSEIWREGGATYLAAGMYADARSALEKFVERRSGDPEGLYYLGKALKAQGENTRATEMFEECIDRARSSPDFRRTATIRWSKLAQKEMNS